MNSILVFKTSVETVEEAERLQAHISGFLGHRNWSFDLDDCDNIFRAEAGHADPQLLIDFFKSFGIVCEELP